MRVRETGSPASAATINTQVAAVTATGRIAARALRPSRMIPVARAYSSNITLMLFGL